MAEEENTSSNIEWEQKKTFTGNTRESRKLDLQKVLETESKARNSFKNKPQTLRNLPSNLKKLRTKIKDAHDDEEDDDDEEEGVVFNFSLEANSGSSLMDALKEDEKNKLQVSQTLKNQKMQQTAGKMEAVMAADKISKQLGLKGIKKRIANNSLQDTTLSSETFDKVISQNVEVKTKLKTEKLSARETVNMVKGLRKIKRATETDEEIRQAVDKKMQTEDIIRIGKEKDDRRAAELILEKSGRQKKEKQSKTKKETQQIRTAIKQSNVRE